MKARWPSLCWKCDTSIAQGDEIRPAYAMKGFDQDRKPIYQRVVGRYRHHPKCPTVTPNRPGQRRVDPLTGEILMSDSSPTQETLL